MRSPEKAKASQDVIRHLGPEADDLQLPCQVAHRESCLSRWHSSVRHAASVEQETMCNIYWCHVPTITRSMLAVLRCSGHAYVLIPWCCC